MITCAVIGGTLLTGGIGSMIGTLFGVLLLMFITKTCIIIMKGCPPVDEAGGIFVCT